MTKIKDHVVREVVNELRTVAYNFHNTQQLRSRIQDALEPLLNHITELEAKAAQWDAHEFWSTGGRQNHGAG